MVGAVDAVKAKGRLPIEVAEEGMLGDFSRMRGEEMDRRTQGLGLGAVVKLRGGQQVAGEGEAPGHHLVPSSEYPLQDQRPTSVRLTNHGCLFA